jgi:lysophospholipase L1-like esterase
MSKHLRWLLVLAGVIFCGAWGLFVFDRYPPGACRELRLHLSGPFEPSQGYEYKADLSPGVLGSGIGSDSNGRGLSPLTLWENGRELAPAHAFRGEIQRTGKGAFVHWGDVLYFSSSDNSDPRTNARTYEVRRTAALPLPVYVAVVIVGYVFTLILLMVLLKRYSDRKWASLLVHVATVAITAIVVELAAWVLVENQLTAYGPLVRNLYQQAFSTRSGPVALPHEPGLTLNYVPHHYLNYVLNPDIAYCGIKQFNAQYRIRRSEPIAREKGDRWRILVIGGSTTFAEGIPKEEDTWPYVLESIIRARCDPRCEVINGGVGGYTLLENFVHYVVLLRDLSPDVVLFYTGINDVHPRLFNEIRADYSNYRIPWRTDGKHMWRPNRWLKSFHAYRYYFLNKVVLGNIYEGIGGQVSRKGPAPSEWSEALARNTERTYHDHLKDFIGLLQAQGVRVGILPQYFSPVNDRDRIFGTGVEKHNQVNEELAKEHGLPFAAELLAPGAFHAEDVFDSCHFTEAGNHKMGAAVFAFLKEHGLLPRCSVR